MKRASHSIYRRLTAWLVLGVGLLLLATGLVIDAVVGQRLRDEYDQALLAKARVLVTLAEQDWEGIEFDLADEVMPEFDDPDAPEYFQLWLGDGSSLERSGSLEESDLARLHTRSDTPRFADLTLPDGRAGRRVQVDFLPRLDLEVDEEDGEDGAVPVAAEELIPQPLTLVLAWERERLDALLSTVHSLLLAAGAVVMALTVLLVRLAVAVSLRPLADIRAQVARLDANSLDSRLQPRQPTEELEGMVRQFNGLLDRLQAAFERERQFSSDVAHELRTPLAELRNLAEVGGRWPDDPKLAREFFSEMLAATRQLERIVENLLALARCEKGLEIVAPTTLDLVTVIDAAWQRVAADARSKDLGFCRLGPAALTVTTGREQLELILNNLFSNAVAYSPAGGSVICAIDDNGGDLRISVANRADHLEPEDLPRLFDRLWRKDPSRSNGHHAGLGLSLVKAYAEQLAMTVQVALEPGPVFRITLRQSSADLQPALRGT